MFIDQHSSLVTLQQTKQLEGLEVVLHLGLVVHWKYRVQSRVSACEKGCSGKLGSFSKRKNASAEMLLQHFAKPRASWGVRREPCFQNICRVTVHLINQVYKSGVKRSLSTSVSLKKLSLFSSGYHGNISKQYYVLDVGSLAWWSEINSKWGEPNWIHPS